MDDLLRLAGYFPKTLYAVGGCVRDGIAGKKPYDVDLAADVSPDDVIACLKGTEYSVSATSPKLMTLKIRGKRDYEYTAFRTDSYSDRGHEPTEVKRTSEIALDALRRDFTMNAVYYDIIGKKYVDPLGGTEDIKNGVVRMTSERTFCEDGLRLMRLCRQTAETGFSVEEKTMEYAKSNADGIKEISPERIRDELNRILVADLRYGNAGGQTKGIELLEETGVLKIILPELTAGIGMEQRKDYHKYDVFGHILQTVRVAPPSIRLAALMHDIAKPYCKVEYGRYAGHDVEGERIARDVLTGLRYPNAVVKEICFLVRNHMYNLKNDVSDKKLRIFIQKNHRYIDKLVALKKADYEGGGVLEGECPSALRIERLYKEMKEEGVPFTLSELKINGDDLKRIGLEGEKIGFVLNELLVMSASDPKFNDREKLTEYIIKKEKRNAD
ncbi:MAG: CCA tRNA nucleotidyltransferase [Christensenellales bacterium]